MRCSRRQLSVIQQSSLCVSVTIYILWVLFTVVCQFTILATYKVSVCLNWENNKAKTTHKRESRSRYRLCVPPCPQYIKRVGIHTVCAWSDWERSMQSRLSRGPTARIVSGFHCVCFAPGNLSLRRELSPAFLAVLAPIMPRRSSGCARGSRRWIRRREWRRASLYLLPFSSIPAPALWDRKPAPRCLPSGEWARRSACLPPRRWTWRMSMNFRKAYCLHKHIVNEYNYKDRNISGERSSHSQLFWEKKRRCWLCFSPLQYIPLPPVMVRGVCPCLWSHGPVPLLLKIWRTDWRRARPISTCIPPI